LTFQRQDPEVPPAGQTGSDKKKPGHRNKKKIAQQHQRIRRKILRRGGKERQDKAKINKKKAV